MSKKKRLIDANALERVIHNGKYAVLHNVRNPFKTQVSCAVLHWCVEKISDAPTVDATEVVHGEWEFDCACEPSCSVCGKYAMIVSDFCPNCGARMDGDSQ